jgi:hypothetical protein
MEFSPPLVPKVRFKFEEIDGDIAYDASGNRNRGNIGGSSACPGPAACPISTLGKTGSAFDFDGDSYVELPATAASGLDIAANHAITVMAWVKLDTFPTVAKPYSYIIGKGYNGTKESYYLRFQSVSGQTVLRFGSYNAAGGGDHVATWTLGAGDIILGNWYHVAGTYDGSSWKVYLDGQPKAAFATPIGPEQNSRNVIIGAFDFNGPIDRFFDGAIDDVKIYDFAMDQDEINSSK